MSDHASFVTTSGMSTEADQLLHPRARMLSTMCSLSSITGNIREAEAFLLELLAFCSFVERGQGGQT